MTTIGLVKQLIFSFKMTSTKCIYKYLIFLLQKQISLWHFATDGNPTCRSDMKETRVVGPNDCNIDPEAVRLSCSATYNGNIPPILKWTRLGDSSPLSMDRTTCKNSTNRVDCNLTITADHLLLNGLSYVCHIEQTTHINCTSDSIDMICKSTDVFLTSRLLVLSVNRIHTKMIEYNLVSI